ncbi:MAG: hypothetical protein EAZ32_06190 [Cytophagia bacterium]|nr:MAG: hypothetical protein EAZ80_06030 [Runella slithyformis]TAG40619.1 MAG: hypothetical protein EAZ32_06190 [Cytophagia bacterium]
MENIKEKILQRLLEFIELKGGFYVVGEVTGVSPQSLYTMRKRGGTPNSEMLAVFAECYPDFDANHILTGRRSVPVSELLRAELELSRLKSDMMDLQQTNKVFLQVALGKSGGEAYALDCPPELYLRDIEGSDIPMAFLDSLVGRNLGLTLSVK